MKRFSLAAVLIAPTFYNGAGRYTLDPLSVLWTVLLVTVCGLAVSLFVCRFPALQSAFGKATEDPQKVRQNIRTCERLSRVFTLTGVLLPTACLIWLFQGSIDPSRIGTANAVGVGSAATAMAFVFLILQPLATRWRLASRQASDDAGRQPVQWIGLLIVGNIAALICLVAMFGVHFDYSRYAMFSVYFD